MIKNNARISKIKEERHLLLNMVNDSIKNNGSVVADDVMMISEVLDYDEKNIKKYEAIVNAQELIVNLTKEITDAKNEEEIIAIRKKLNYYINKIKNEIKKRNINPEYLEKYQNSISYLRKDIAKYIRFLKRANTICEIENLNSNYESLSEEDKEKLKKLLRTEARYNHRNLNYKEKTNSKPKDNKNISHEGMEKRVLEQNNTQKDEKIPETNKQEKNTIGGLDIDKFVDTVKKAAENSIISDVEYLEKRIKDYNISYRIDTTYDYSKSIFVDIVSMIKNIPIYLQNQKKIKYMEQESERFYRGADLISYIAYLKQKNSIRQALKSVFNRTYLYSSEGQLLNNHEECAKWLMDYCQRESLQINPLKRAKSL